LISPGGIPERILKHGIDGHFEVVTSPSLLSELENVVRRPHIRERIGWSSERLATLLTLLAGSASPVSAETRVEVIMADPADNRVLEAALAGEAEYIVSGDNHLLSLGTYAGIEIISPARFVAVLATLSDR
jgi:putative PIN family toxin of toxin-antitoxin system